MLKYSDIEADQLRCIDFIGSGEDSLVCADVGTGKTLIALTAADHALMEGEICRWLVLAPLLVATDTWALEPEQWEHLRHLKLAIAAGKDEAERIAVIEGDADIVVLNYENLQWLMDRYPRPRKGKPETLPFDGLICDEIDKLKEVSSKRFKAFRERVKVFKKRIGLTGTLIPNRLLEAWGQVYVVDGGHSFGRSFYKWRAQHFYPTDYKQFRWAPFPVTRDYIIDSIKDLAFRLKAVGLPDVVPVSPHYMTLDPETLATYKKLEAQFFLTLEDKQKRVRVIDAANSAVLSGKLQQICAGFSYVPPVECAEHHCPIKLDEKEKFRCAEHDHLVPNDAVWHSTARFEWLHKLSTELGPEQLLIFYQFREELEQLRTLNPDLAVIGGGVPAVKARRHIADWNAGKLRRMALHPASAGHGLNLQKSAAQHIAFLTMPWSGGMYKQVVGRLARRGSRARQIFVHTALFLGTVDEEVFGAATGRVAGLESFLDDLELATAA